MTIMINIGVLLTMIIMMSVDIPVTVSDFRVSVKGNQCLHHEINGETGEFYERRAYESRISYHCAFRNRQVDFYHSGRLSKMRVDHLV